MLWPTQAIDELLPSPLDVWFVLGNRATVPLLADEPDTDDYHAHLATLEWLAALANGGWGTAIVPLLCLAGALEARAAEGGEEPLPYLEALRGS